MADHQHVNVFIKRVDGVGPRGVGGGGQHIGFAHYFQNIRRMATARTFCVEGVNGAALEGRYGIFHKARLVQCVGVNSHLCVGFFCHVQAVVDGGGCGAPVFMKLETNGAGLNLFTQRARQRGIAFA